MEDALKGQKKWEALRGKAEKLVPKQTGPGPGLADLDALSLVHELEVHHIELKRQSDELRRAKVELEASLKEYADLYHFAPVAYLDVNRQGVIIRANMAASAMLDLPAEALKGRALSRFIHMEDHKRYFDIVLEVIRGKEAGGRGRGELRLVRDSGIPVWAHMEIGPSYDVKGGLLGWHVAFMDITRPKQAETALQQSEAKYRSIFQAAKDALILTDQATGRILDANPSACDLYGYTREELLDRREADLLGGPPETPSEPGLGAHGVCLAYHRKKDGTVFPAEVSVSRYSQDGRSVLTSAVRDISERQKAEGALEKAYREIEESEVQLRNLSCRLLTVQEEERKRVARDLHDSVGQTLAALKFSIENALINADHEDPEAAFHVLDALIPSVRAAIDEIRSIYTGLRPTILDDLGILATIHWFCREFRKTYPHHYIEIEEDIDEAAIPQELKIVLFRIIQEALSNVAGHSGAELITVTLNQRGDMIELMIEDNGIGFEEKDIALKRAENPKRGIGLASMRERAELSGGSLTIESVKGEGTRVRALWKILAG